MRLKCLSNQKNNRESPHVAQVDKNVNYLY
jgi:hypothetical protein